MNLWLSSENYKAASEQYSNRFSIDAILPTETGGHATRSLENEMTLLSKRKIMTPLWGSQQRDKERTAQNCGATAREERTTGRRKSESARKSRQQKQQFNATKQKTSDLQTVAIIRGRTTTTTVAQKSCR